MMSRTRLFLVLPAVLAALLVVFAPAAARAEIDFSLGASVGLVEGTAQEVVFYYPRGRKVQTSELIWDLKDVVMGGVHGSVDLGRRFRFTVDAWSALTGGTGMMVDRDWRYSSSVSAFLVPTDYNWTDESRHPDTSLDKGIVVDPRLSILALQAGPFALRGLVGYKYDAWKWTARGGTYLYSTEYYGSRDATGTFLKGQKVITYEQQYSIPYFGVGASWTRPAFQVEMHGLFSRSVFGSDSDYHVLRGVLFEGDFSGGTFFGLGLNATWAFAPHWCATLGVEYQSIPVITGDVTISGDEGPGSYGNGGGMGMSATRFALGVGYRF
jgi:outer membrane protease